MSGAALLLPLRARMTRTDTTVPAC